MDYLSNPDEGWRNYIKTSNIYFEPKHFDLTQNQYLYTTFIAFSADDIIKYHNHYLVIRHDLE